MTVRGRILAIQLTERIRQDSAYAKQIGLSVEFKKIKNEKMEENKNENYD